MKHDTVNLLNISNSWVLRWTVTDYHIKSTRHMSLHMHFNPSSLFLPASHTASYKYHCDIKQHGRLARCARYSQQSSLWNPMLTCQREPLHWRLANVFKINFEDSVQWAARISKDSNGWQSELRAVHAILVCQESLSKYPSAESFRRGRSSCATLRMGQRAAVSNLEFSDSLCSAPEGLE